MRRLLLSRSFEMVRNSTLEVPSRTQGVTFPNGRCEIPLHHLKCFSFHGTFGSGSLLWVNGRSGNSARGRSCTLNISFCCGLATLSLLWPCSLKLSFYVINIELLTVNNRQLITWWAKSPIPDWKWSINHVDNSLLLLTRMRKRYSHWLKQWNWFLYNLSIFVC